MALVGVEFHQPVFFPLTDGRNVALQLYAIIYGPYLSLYYAIISKKSNYTVLGTTWKVVDVN